MRALTFASARSTAFLPSRGSALYSFGPDIAEFGSPAGRSGFGHRTGVIKLMTAKGCSPRKEVHGSNALKSAPPKSWRPFPDNPVFSGEYRWPRGGELRGPWQPWVPRCFGIYSKTAYAWVLTVASAGA